VAKIEILKAKDLAFLGNGMHPDGRGLYLRVTGGSKSWVYRFYEHGRERRMGLGSYPTVSLADARFKANQQRVKVASGEDVISPTQAKQEKTKAVIAHKESTKTFLEVMQDFLVNKGGQWTNPKHAKQWQSTLNKFCGKYLHKPIDTITESEVVKSIEEHWLGIPETANRTRGRIEAIFGYAIAKKLYHHQNPARKKDHLEHILASHKRIKKRHHPSLPYELIQDFWKALDLHKGSAVNSLRMQILTATRQGEVRQATFDEFDLNSNPPLWKIPAEHHKLREQFEVPLSKQVVELVKDLQKTAKTKFLFPNQTGKNYISDSAVSNLIKDMNQKDHRWIDKDKNDVVPHGFRSTFRHWSSKETEFGFEILEECLSHRVGNKVAMAYLRESPINKRAEVMQEWANFVTGKKNVKKTK
jgi:integrase